MMRSKRTLAAALTAAILGGLVTIGASPALALSSEESQFASAHNNIRASNGRRSLSLQSDLTSVARRHSGRMAARGSIWHNPNLGSEVSGWTVVGENVGMGPSVDDLMDAFMDSPGHRSNILDTDYNQFGVGVVIKDGTIYVTVVFAKRSRGTVATKTTTTTTKPRLTTTTRSRSTSSATKPAASASKPAAPAPAAPKPAAPQSRTVSMLVQMIGLDSPATGAASG